MAVGNNFVHGQAHRKYRIRRDGPQWVCEYGYKSGRFVQALVVSRGSFEKCAVALERHQAESTERTESTERSGGCDEPASGEYGAC